MGNKLKYILSILFLFFAFFFTYSYLSKEVPLYACDYVEQNIFWHDFSKLLFENPIEFCKQLTNDIYWHNRNPFSIMPILPFAYIFKNFRFGFLFTVETCYMFPVLLLVWYLFNKYFLNNKEQQNEKLPFKKRKLLLFLSSIFFFPAVWHSVIQGMPDIIGMIFILLCFILYFKYDFNKKTPFKIILLFSFLLYLSFLSRRWYSIVILSFFTSIMIENLTISIKENDKFKKASFTLMNLGIISVIISLLAFIIQGGYVKNIIQNEMAERLAFTVDYNQWYTITIGNLGLIVCLIALIGLIFNFKNRLIRFCSFNILIYAMIYIVLLHNQFLWINHYCYIAILMCILFCAGLYTIVELIKNDKCKNVFIAIAVIFNLYNFYSFFIFERPYQLKYLFPETNAYPMKSQDFDIIKDFYSYLKNEYNKDNNIKVGIYGICNSFGYWQLRSINPDNDFAKNALGFERILNSDFEDANYDEDYVIIFNPLGIYAPDDVSTKIKEIGEMFEKNYGYAKNYNEVKKIKLSDEKETEIKLYKRKTK